MNFDHVIVEVTCTESWAVVGDMAAFGTGGATRVATWSTTSAATRDATVDSTLDATPAERHAL